MCHETLFHLCVPVGEKILRTVIVYTFIVIAFRVAGKRTLGQFNSFDLVVLITISNAVQNAVIGQDNTVSGGLIGAATLLIVDNVLVRLTYHLPKLDSLLEGTETVLYEGGRFNGKAMARELVSENELMTAVRRQGARSLDEVDKIALEPTGNVLVTIKQDATLQLVLRELRDLRGQIEAKS
jgi:uncharacterized membrane protein YcaP (DUF421 family)